MSLNIVSFTSRNRPVAAEDRERDEAWSGSKMTIAVPTACAVAWLLMVMWEVW